MVLDWPNTVLTQNVTALCDCQESLLVRQILGCPQDQRAELLR
jgi:hypothetical protein